MNEEVWISDILADSEVTLSVTNDLLQRDEDAFIQGQRLLERGQAVPESLCPKRIWGSQERDVTKLKSVPDLFGANGQYFVSEKAANILRQFDLGGGYSILSRKEFIRMTTRHAFLESSSVGYSEIQKPHFWRSIRQWLAPWAAAVVIGAKCR